MNSALRKIVVASIGDQWIKRTKDMVLGYTIKSLMELMDCIYVRYGQIAPRGLMRNQDEMKVTYNAEYPIEILFD